MRKPDTALFEFEEVPTCILCGTEEQHDAKGSSWHGVAFSYCICPGCGLKYMRPRPTVASYVRFYQDDYWQQNLAGAGYASNEDFADSSRDQLEHRMPKYRKAYESVRANLAELELLHSRCSFLEVGCAFGFTPEWLKRDYGCRVFGVEPSSTAVERCEAAGVPIIARTGEDLASEELVTDERFDVILFRHALDPIVDPVRVLAGVRRYLKDDGVLLIHCVNVEFYDAMDPYHPFLYSPTTLRRLLAKVGFAIFRHDHPPSPVDRATAVSITSPSYQQVAFARKAEPRELPVDGVDPIRIAKTNELGAAVKAWDRLGIKDMMKQLALRSFARSRQTIERAYRRTRQ